MKLCFLVSEYFRWGKYGGYGTSTRLLATELVKRGIDVTVLTPRRGAQPAEELIDGVKVFAYSACDIRRLNRLCRQQAADIYHSHEPSLATAVAMRAMPGSKHIVTCRDTRLVRDWLIEMGAWILDGSFITLMTFPYENNPWVTRAVREADGIYCPNEFSRAMAQKKFGLSEQPEFLPSPIRLPDDKISKAEKPTFCYLGRWDNRKRPELFFQLAEQFPQVRFVAIGKARTRSMDQRLRKRYGQLDNVELTGFIDQFSSTQIFKWLASSWGLINTSLREGLPRSFMEAGASGCAILSRVDPDGFASRFGFRATHDNFSQGLEWLLEDSRWRPLGEAARQYVTDTYGLRVAVSSHVDIYQKNSKHKTRFG